VLNAIGSLQTADAIYAIEIILEYLHLEFQRILHGPPLDLTVLHLEGV
jgi:hypothetical protein